MNKRILTLPFILLLSLVLLVSCTQLGGKDQESGTLEFTLTSNGQGYKVTGIGSHEGKTVTIPDSYESLPVVYIAEGAFKNNKEGCRLESQ